MNSISTALVQQRMRADYQSNLEASLAEIQTSASRGAKLVVLCELHTSLYFCQEESARNFELAQTIPGPLTDQLACMAKQNRIVIVGSVFEKRARGLYHNTAVVLDRDGSLAGTYRKMHVPDGPGYHEKYYFASGDSGFSPIQTSIGKLGVMVCWDQWFPEAARLMALAGAQLLIFPTAIGWNPEDHGNEMQQQLEAWQIIQQSHAIANHVPVLCVNRVGHEADPCGRTGGIDFWGKSFACDASGKITAQCPDDRAETLLTRVNLTQTERLRQIWPYLRDRRIDAYGKIDRRLIDE